MNHKIEELSPREIDVLNQVKEGRTAYSEVASDLSISLDTVKRHFENIYAKLELKSELVKSGNVMIKALIKAIRLGYIKYFEPSIKVEETPIYKKAITASSGGKDSEER